MNMLSTRDTSMTPSTHRLCRAVLLGLAGLMLSSCGFEMQGQKPLPFDTLYITIPQNSQFGADIRRAIRAVSPDTKLIEPSDMTLNNQAPQAKLEQLSDLRNTRQVSLNAQGKVEELELSIRYSFRLVTSKDQIIIPETMLSAARNMPFDDRVVQAKEGEAATLFKDMQRSLVTRMIRRITAPDVKARWDQVAAERSEDDAPIEIAKPVRTPEVIPSTWPNPSLTPSPTAINPD
jgi:LPS-assembly lipoprotein